MNIIKRNGETVPYNGEKIKDAIRKANKEVSNRKEKLTEKEIDVIEERVRTALENETHASSVEDIQDMVITNIYSMNKPVVGSGYAIYRYKHNQLRRGIVDEPIIAQSIALLDLTNEEASQENANKNVDYLSTQRDYLAGFINKYLSWKHYYNVPELVEYHTSGKGHHHDADYIAMRMHNCGLINLDDCLQNGTEISGRHINKPRSFRNACTITTQIIAQVASLQYGGQTFNLAHLAPFVEVSRRRLRKNYIEKYEVLYGSCDAQNEAPSSVQDEVDKYVADAKRPRTDYDDIETMYEKHPAIVEYRDEIEALIDMDIRKEITDGIQSIQYQLITLMTTNGQAPFVSMYINIEELDDEPELQADLVMLVKEVLMQRIVGVPNEKGVFLPTAFPKILYVVDECNKPGEKFAETDAKTKSKFWDITYLAAICSANVMTPDYISAKEMRKLKDGDVYACMGCRSFLTVDRFSEKYGNIAGSLNYEKNPHAHKYWGRFNQGVSTINLVHAALSSGKDEAEFWKILEERTELNHKFLRMRHERLLGTPSDVAPLLWQHGVYGRLKKGETIDKLLYHGYSTISLGYAGLYECVKYMTGKSHMDGAEGEAFGLKVLQFLNDQCKKWREAEDIDYSLYGTPMESTTYKFAKADQRDFGQIEGITDKNYITNSYHQHVTEKSDGFTKLTRESKFQKLSPGGAISYIEMPDMQGNIPAVMAYIQFIYDDIMYAEFNIKKDYCEVCGFEGTIDILQDKDTKQFYWKCPHCGNTDRKKMHVFRRMCGYPGENECNQGRYNEFADRVLHVDSKMMPYEPKN